MSNAYSPPPEGEPRAAAAPEPVDYEELPETGVRKVLRAYDVRARQWTRWGAVLAGVFISFGASIFLTTLGLALGVSALNPIGPNPVTELGVGTAIWWAVQSLVTMFIGAYAAAKLGGSVRRSDGMVSGLLTWAVSLLATIWFVGSVASLAVSGALSAANVATNVPGVVAPRAGAAPTPTPQQLQVGKTAAAGTLWYAFGITAGTLLAALAGGAAGAVGKLTPKDQDRLHRPGWAREREEDRVRAAG